MSGIDRAERVAHRLGALVAIAAACTLVPGLVSAVRERGPASGRPELVFTPVRLLAVGLGWFGMAGAAWRPLPARPGRIVRWTLLAGGLVTYLVGMGFAVAGRLALGSSYRPSSSVGATLAPDHRLVTSGPFGIVRHPMYLGLALAAIGALAVYRTWSTLLFVIQLPVLVVRARREEALLARRFGEAWEAYARRIPAGLPFSRGSPPARATPKRAVATVGRAAVPRPAVRPARDRSRAVVGLGLT
jgi:protein-S-isoprenylcysteine O-methyltransferase Ste14